MVKKMNHPDKVKNEVALGMHRQQPLSESCALAQKRWVQTPSPAPLMRALDAR